MNEENRIHPQETIDVLRLARAIRAAIVGMVIPLSYLSLHTSLSIGKFGAIFHDMLGGKPLPVLTQWVLYTAPVFVGLAFLVPIIALATLFYSNVARSFYILGALGLMTFVEFIVLYKALSAPFSETFKAMGGTA